MAKQETADKKEDKNLPQGDAGTTGGPPADTGAPQGTPGDTGVTGGDQGGSAATGAPQGTPAAAGAAGADQGDDKGKKTGSKRRRQYAFPTVSRCPRCRTTDTKATSTKGPVQYRECRRAICRWKYTVRGKKV